MSETTQSPRAIICGAAEVRNRSEEEGGETNLVSGDKVADEEEDGHHDVLSDRDDVGARDLEDLDTALDGSVEVDVVRADTGSDAGLEVLGLCMSC